MESSNHLWSSRLCCLAFSRLALQEDQYAAHASAEQQWKLEQRCSASGRRRFFKIVGRISGKMMMMGQ